MGQEPWKEFFAGDDSEGALLQKGIKLAPALLNTTADDINYLFDKAEDFNIKIKGEKLEAIFDLLTLKLKLIDGLALLYLKKEARDYFTNALMLCIGRVLIHFLEQIYSKEVSDKIRRGATSHFYNFSWENLKEYDEYTELGDILLHFSNKFAEKYTKNNDVKNMSIFTKSIVDALSETIPE